MPAWTTPLLRPVWCIAPAGSFSRTVTSCPGRRSCSSRATASPTMPPPTTMVLRPASTTSGISGGAGHRQDVEGRVELLLRQVAAFDVAALDDHLPDRLALLQRLLRHLGGVLVADVLVQRRDDRRRRLGQLAAAFLVGLDAVDHAIRQQPG